VVIDVERMVRLKEKKEDETMNKISKSPVLTWLLMIILGVNGFLFAAEKIAASSPKPLSLQSITQPRQLPEHLLGASVLPFYERLLNVPRKVAIVKQMKLGLVRFPGGTLGNYYNWRTGLPEATAKPDSSEYVRYWATLAPNIQRSYPNGIHIEEYSKFAADINAAVDLLPNLENSTVAEQTEWFKQMKADGSLPNYIELGNEFYFAMMNDPDNLKKWPDYLSPKTKYV
jgi:hypothetical protein